MATFEIQGPNGEVFEVEAPDQNAAISAFQSMQGGNQAVASDTMRERRNAVPSTNLLEQTMSGVNEGIGGMLGFPVDAVTSAINGAGRAFGREAPLINNPVGGSEWLNQNVLGPTISDTQPQDMAQRYGRRIGREVGAMAVPAGAMMRGAKTPLALAGMETASAVGAGLAGQTSQEIAPGNQTADVIASIAGGMTPFAASHALRASPRAPSMDDLRAQQAAKYDAVNSSQARLPQSDRDGLVSAVQQRAAVEDMDEFLHPRANRTVSRMDSLEPSPRIADVEKKRRLIGRDVAGSMDPSESAIGVAMKDEVDAYLDQVAKAGSLGVDATETLNDLQDARRVTQKIKKAEAVQEALSKAERRAATSGTGGNEVNAIRQNIRSILDSPAKRRGYSQEELDLMEGIVRGTPGVNAMRMVGRLSPTSGALPMMGNMASVAGGASMGPAGALIGGIPATAGLFAKALAERTTQKQVDNLLSTIRNGGKLAAKGVNPDDVRGALAALFARTLQANNSAE